MIRLLCELVVILALVALGWQKSFHEWVDEARGDSKVVKTQEAKQHASASAGPRQSSHASGGPHAGSAAPKSVADQPVYDGKRSFTGHVFYKDSQGKTYWIDGSGKRHYEP